MDHISKLIPIAINKESQIQEYKPPKTSEEAGFEMAILKPKIVNSSLEELKQALRYVFILIGLKADQIPVKEEKSLLLEYIIENYGGHTPDEIKLAFKMAIQGKLNLAYKEVISYGNFSPIYFTIIMDAYRIWAKDQIKMIKLPQKERGISEKDKLNIAIDFIAYQFKLINKLPIKFESGVWMVS